MEEPRCPGQPGGGEAAQGHRRERVPSRRLPGRIHRTKPDRRHKTDAKQDDRGGDDGDDDALIIRHDREHRDRRLAVLPASKNEAKGPEVGRRPEEEDGKQRHRKWADQISYYGASNQRWKGAGERRRRRCSAASNASTISCRRIRRRARRLAQARLPAGLRRSRGRGNQSRQGQRRIGGHCGV